MPKVSAEYFKNKKDEILDAAYRVAMSKPMHEVSMRDIITESGLSQGGIYRYFGKIDDVLIELINRKSNYYNVEVETEHIITKGGCPEEMITEFFYLWKKAFFDNLMGVGKIYYELSTLYANDPKRLSNFILNSTLFSEEKVFQEKCFSYITQKIEEGYLKPKIPLEDIIKLLITSFDGIIRDMILTKYYKANDSIPFTPDFNGDSLIYSLCVSFVLLLGGNEKRIKQEVFSDGADK